MAILTVFSTVRVLPVCGRYTVVTILRDATDYKKYSSKERPTYFFRKIKTKLCRYVSSLLIIFRYRQCLYVHKIGMPPSDI